jgi:hypothetical protein
MRIGKMTLGRSITQMFLKGRILLVLAAVVEWLRLDRALDTTARWVRRRSRRMLTPVEIHEALRVFGNSIPYEDVRIVEDSALARRVARISSSVHLAQEQKLAVTLFRTVHFSTRLAQDGSDMPWLIHELTHVWQYCQWGPRYLVDALHAQAEHGHAAYDITQGMAEHWPWNKFNFEQQGDVARACYVALSAGDDASRFAPYAAVLCNATPTRKRRRAR